MPRQALILATLFLALGSPAEARLERSAQVVREFRQTHACPSTGRFRGPCPNYVVDHLWPLCAGGADRTWNMAWQELADSKRKDRWEKAICRGKR